MDHSNLLAELFLWILWLADTPIMATLQNLLIGYYWPGKNTFLPNILEVSIDKHGKSVNILNISEACSIY
jgi:hypothetical protein